MPPFTESVVTALSLLSTKRQSRVESENPITGMLNGIIEPIGEKNVIVFCMEIPIIAGAISMI